MTDTSYLDDNVRVAVWSNAELTTAIFCATLSGIKPFVQWVSTRKSLSRQSYSFKIPGTPFNSGNRRASKMNPALTTQHLGSEPSSTRLTKENEEREATGSEIELSSNAV